MDQQIINNLKKINLTDKEIAVYLTLLEHGNLPASEISYYSLLNRTTVYDNLKLLLQKGLAYSFIKKEIKYFTAAQPEKILDILEKDLQKKQEIKNDFLNILPSLNTLYQTKVAKTKIQIADSGAGLKELYLSMYKGGKYPDEGLEFASWHTFKETVPLDLRKELQNLRVKNNIWVRQVVVESKYTNNWDDPDAANARLKKIRLIPDSWNCNYWANYEIFGDKMIILNLDEKIVHGIMIENHALVSLTKIMFEALWEKASQYGKCSDLKKPAGKKMEKYPQLV
jgi:predicted DNA-binding transcriptional regulator